MCVKFCPDLFRFAIVIAERLIFRTPKSLQWYAESLCGYQPTLNETTDK